MLTDPKYQPLREKIIRETNRNILLATWTADMHGSVVPDMANLYFGLSHPVYDGMMDSEIDEGPNAPDYSTAEKHGQSDLNWPAAIFAPELFDFRSIPAGILLPVTTASASACHSG